MQGVFFDDLVADPNENLWALGQSEMVFSALLPFFFLINTAHELTP